MKKKYTTPMCEVVTLRALILNNSSSTSQKDEYWDNQGRIKVGHSIISADRAD
jgi:hypothetical protein